MIKLSFVYSNNKTFDNNICHKSCHITKHFINNKRLFSSEFSTHIYVSLFTVLLYIIRGYLRLTYINIFIAVFLRK